MQKQNIFLILTSDQFTKLQDIFTKNKFTNEEQHFWVNKIGEVPVDFRSDVIKFLQEFPNQRQWLKDYSQRQDEALRNTDYNAWKTLGDELNQKIEEIAEEE